MRSLVQVNGTSRVGHYTVAYSRVVRGVISIVKL